MYLDTALDLASIGYDLYQLTTGGWDRVGENLALLGLDLVGAALPGVAGLGVAARAGRAAHLADNAAVELAMHGRSVAPVERTLEHGLNKDAYLLAVADRYGINLRGVKPIYDPALPPGQLGLTKRMDGGRVIRIGRDAFVDEPTIANTIAHELSHARDYLRGGVHKPHGGIGSLADGIPYGSGNALEQWIRGRR